MVRLNRTHYSLLKFTGKIFQFFRHLPRQRTLQNSSELRKFRAIRPHRPRMTQIRTIYSHYTLRFRCLTSGKERREIPANQVKFARFAPIPCELREFHALRTKINTYVIDFQISDHRQRTQENWSESTRFCSIRPPITRITQVPCISQ